MKPIVSVIVPVYNGEKTIKKCLDSILAQTLKEIEVIVVNDNSTDSTLDVLKSYKKKIVVINNEENLGPAGSRNKGLAKAKGKFIGFVDADDYIDENMYKTMLDNMSDDTDLVCCSRYNVKGGELKPIINESKTTNIKEFSKTSSYTWDKLYRKSIIDDNNIYFPERYSYAEDFCFLMKYKFYSNKMIILDEPLYYYKYDSFGSITNSYDERIYDIIDALSDTVKFFQSQEAFEENYYELLLISAGFYVRRIKEFGRFTNYKLKKEFVHRFLNFFKNYFPDYKRVVNTFGTDRNVFYRSNYHLMLMYIKYKEKRLK